MRSSSSESNSKALWRRNTSHHSLTPLSRQRTPLSPQKYSLIPRRASSSTAPAHLHSHSSAVKTGDGPSSSRSTLAVEGGGGIKAHRSISADAIGAIGKAAAAAQGTNSTGRLEVPSNNSAHQTTH